MSDLRDFTGKNRKFTGAAGIIVSDSGLGSGDRVNEKGRLRFNDTTDLLEYYNGAAWKAIDAPPVITTITIDGGSAVTSGVVDNEGGGSVTIEVNGSLFDTTGANVTLVGAGETLSTTSLTRNSGNLLTAVFTESQFDIGNSPYTLKVTNGSGLSAELAEAISADQSTIAFNQSADTTVTLSDASRGAGISAAALCGASGATNFAVTTGSLPSGLSMTAGTGAITGTANAVGSNTTSTFTVTATGDDSTSTRQFKITINAPIITTYNSPGTWPNPGSVNAVNVLVVAGGAGAGSQHAGGGGAGGLIYRPAFPVSGNQSVTIGGGSSGGPNNHNPSNGSDSAFGSLTAKGGGGAGHGWPGGPNVGKPGGSGGGASSPGTTPGGSATQPTQPGDSGTYGFGHAGGNNDNGNSGAGGGGAGAVGTPNSGNRSGGAGKAYSISGSSVTYAGGGGGASHSDGSGGSGGSGGGGIGGTHPASSGAGSGAGGTGTAHRGSGGGGGSDDGRVGGSGGSGVVIVAF
jgi:hypothetical protein